MSEWKTVKIGDVCEKGSSNIAQNEIADNNGEYPIYGAAGFIKNVDFYKQDKPYIGIVKDGAGVGRVSVHPAKSSLIGTMQYIFPKENIDIKFLAEFLKYQNLSRFYTGATIPHIYFKDYQNIPLKLPSLQKQKHISAVLGKCAELTVKNKRILEKYDTLIKSRFIEMFGDNSTENGKWNIEKIEDVCTVTSSKRIYAEEQSTTGVPFLRISDLVSRINGNPINDLFIPNSKFKEFQTKGLVPSVNDILITSRGTLGLCYIIKPEDEFYFQDGMITWLAFKNHNKVLSVFIDWLFKSVLKTKIDNETNGATVKYVSISDLKKLQIPVPPLSLQNDFAAFVQQIDKSKFAVQKSLEKAETLYKSLMQQYFA